MDDQGDEGDEAGNTDDDNFSSYLFELSGVENGTVTWSEEYLMKELRLPG